MFDEDDDRVLKGDHVTVDTVQARLETMVKSELCKFSAVADQEKRKIIQVCLVCQGMRPEVETALKHVALRPAVDRFVLFEHEGDVRKKRAARDHHETLRTHRLQLVDEAKSQSYAKTPILEHISQLEVFADWTAKGLQADAEDVVKSIRAKMVPTLLD